MNTTTPTTGALPQPLPRSEETAPVRAVEGIHKSTTFHWVGNGFHVSTYFPSQRLAAERVSPFVLMDYGPPKDFGPLAKGKRGVGWHPHRGFETVTLAWEGSVAHRDNAGHRGVIGPGDVQWMTAGAGIFHEEFHEDAFAREGGRMHMMQLWVNLPKKDKTAKPAYQPITSAQIPVVALPSGGSVRVIAGEFQGARGPAHTFTPITMLDVNLVAGERFEATLPASYNVLAVVAKGSVETDGLTGETGELVLFANPTPGNSGSRIALTAESDAHLIVLAGEPIKEPIVQYGPFVMNTMAEIKQAMLDVDAGRFGPIPD